jgi:Zn ribbon nucleic-acid-binding protein
MTVHVKPIGKKKKCNAGAGVCNTCRVRNLWRRWREDSQKIRHLDLEGVTI